jgi:hypothetical protein
MAPMAPISDYHGNNATYLSDFLNHTIFDSLKSDTTAILNTCILLSYLANFLLFTTGVAWAAVQYKLVSRLTAILSGMQWSARSCRSELSNRGSTKNSRYKVILRFIFYWVMHLSMYCFCVRSRPSFGSPGIQAIIISSFPLAVPYKIYSEWPILSTGFLICWGQLWIYDTLLGFLCTILSMRSEYHSDSC